MFTKSNKLFAVVFFSILALHIIIDNLNSRWSYLTKPAVLFVLLIYFLRNSSHLQKNTRYAMAIALVFSLFGDMLLMFTHRSGYFFTAGLASFLAAHVMFMVVFIKKRNPQVSILIFATILLAYAVGLFYLIKGNLADMLVPVVVYIVVILSMSMTAFVRKGHVNSVSYMLVFIGALFFLMSDSILALNKFYKTILYPQITIMLTYGLAQFLITLGVLKQDN